MDFYFINCSTGLVFTSPRSVEATNLCLKEHQVDISHWAELPTYVVGEATGQLVLQKLHLSSKGQESGNAAALAQYIINGNRLLVSSTRSVSINLN